MADNFPPCVCHHIPHDDSLPMVQGCGMCGPFPFLAHGIFQGRVHAYCIGGVVDDTHL